VNTFPALGLRPELLRALEDTGYETPTPIQAQAIPPALRGADVLGCAQTGTGKTAGFLLPTLHRLAGHERQGAPDVHGGPRGREPRDREPRDREPRDRGASPRPTRGRPRALILTPTRELAAQIGDNTRVYGKYLPLRHAVVFGGVGFGPQAERLKQGVDIVIATPGRLLDHLGQGTVDFMGLEILVLDEADRMFDMGFLPDVRRILKALPAARQTLFFAATMPPEIERLIHEVLRSPVVIQVGRRSKPADAVRQVAYAVHADFKKEALARLLSQGVMHHVLVFTRTKARADSVARYLARGGQRVEALHGNKSQNARTRALERFRSGKVDVLVATDIAARGIDVEGISHVINFDMPNVPEDYVHRIGRTARAEATGDAISLVAPEEAPYVRSIERLTGIAIPRLTLPGFDPSHRTLAEPLHEVSARRPRRTRLAASRRAPMPPCLQARAGPSGRSSGSSAPRVGGA
jgi:ATP-dependent RNA helicase RhlE